MYDGDEQSEEREFYLGVVSDLVEFTMNFVISIMFPGRLTETGIIERLSLDQVNDVRKYAAELNPDM